MNMENKKNFRFRPARQSILAYVMYWLVYIIGIIFVLFWAFYIYKPTLLMLLERGLTFLNFLNSFIYMIGNIIFLVYLIPTIANIFYPENKEEYEKSKYKARLRWEFHQKRRLLRKEHRNKLKELENGRRKS